MSAHTVEVLVDSAYEGQAPVDPVRRAARAALAHQSVEHGSTLTVVITGDSAVRELNRRHRGVDATTDVLAYPNAPPGPFVGASEEPGYLGDVVIAFPQARVQAAQLGHGTIAELQLLTVHGVLHLLGHDDTVESKRTNMWAAQAQIMEALGVDAALPTSALKRERPDEVHATGADQRTGEED